jgi:NADH-quinone oxidoreductase subunit F
MLKRSEYLTKNYGAPEAWTLGLYERDGGYRSARSALGMTREALVDEIKKAHIRGRGGAGFD